MYFKVRFGAIENAQNKQMTDKGQFGTISNTRKYTAFKSKFGPVLNF